MRPSFMPFSAMRMAFKASYEQWATAERLAEAMAEKSNLNDTHPALSDRIEAIAQKAALPSCIEVSAADALLGGTTTKTLIAEFDQEWWSKESKKWETRCKYVFRSKARLKELSALPLSKVALLDLQEFALLIAEFDTPHAAKPVLEHLLKQAGGPFPKAAFVYGHILLDEDNGRGLEHLEHAAANDRRLIEQAAQLGYDFLLKHQGDYAAHVWWKKIMPDQASD
jgi:hypothetical protein